MLEIIEAKTRADMRAFFRAAKRSGYTKKEEKYLEMYAFSPLSLLSQNGPQSFVVAKRDGKSVFRVLTGVDMRYVRKEECPQGYFSVFDGEKDEEAARAILKAVMEKQRNWGMKRVIGPIAPDGSGFFMGAGEGDFSGPRGIFTGPDASFQCGILRSEGFLPVKTECAYEIELGKENPLSAVARKAEERFHVEIMKMNTGLFSTDWIKRILDVSKEAPQNEMRLMLERIRPFIETKHSYIAFSGNVSLGYLVSLKKDGGILRAATLITSSEHFSVPAVLALIDAFLSGAKKDGLDRAEISVVDSRNLRSERLVLRFDGRKHRQYTVFTKNV